MPRHHMRPEDLSLLRWSQDAQLSPDASRLAWCEVSLDPAEDRPVTQLMIARADGEGEPRRFSDGPADFLPRWSPDGRHLAYLSASGDAPSLRLSPLAGGAPVEVKTPGAVSWIDWSPSGDALVLVVNVPPPPSGATPEVERNAPIVVRGLSNRLDGEGWFSGRKHLFVYELEGPSLRQLTRGDYDHSFPAWSPDGASIVFISDRTAERDNRFEWGDIWVLPSAGGKLSRVTRGIGGAAFPSFSPDGRMIAFTGALRAEEQDQRDGRIFVVTADGSSTPRVVAPDLDRPTGAALGPFTPYGWLAADELLFTVVHSGTVGISRAKLSARTAKPVVENDSQVSGVSVAGAGRGRRFAYTAAWVDSTSEVFCSPMASGAAARVSRAGDAMLAEVDLLPATRKTARAPDGLEIEYFLIDPPHRGVPRSGRRGRPRKSEAAREGGAPPLFLEIHGGPSLYNPISFLFPYYQVLAAAGYAVLLPNPRGSIGYGEGFRRCVTADWGGADFEDLMACADDAIERGLGDGRRQYVGGYSYGGFMTAWIVGQTTRFRAAWVGAPVTDQVAMFGTTDATSFLASSLGGDPWDAADAFRFRSPLTHAPKVTTPVLLHVNEGDLRCPPGQADEFFCALKWLRKEVEYVRYPGGSHLSHFPQAGAPSQSKDRMTRLLQFLSRHGGPARAAGEAGKPRPGIT